MKFGIVREEKKISLYQRFCRSQYKEISTFSKANKIRKCSKINIPIPKKNSVGKMIDNEFFRTNFLSNRENLKKSES